MRTTILGAVAVVATAGLAAFAAVGIAGEDAASRTPVADDALEPVAVEPASPRLARRAASPRGQTLTYFEVPTPLDVPPRTEVAVELSKCPRGSKAVGGYFDPERPGTFLDQSRPVLSTARMWAIGAFNSTDTAERVTFGLVCLSRVK